MIFTNEDRLKKKYGGLYDKFNEIKHLADPDDKLQKVEKLVVDICFDNKIPTRLPSGKMRWEVWQKMDSMLRDMGILAEPNPKTVDIGGIEEMMNGKKYPEFPKWKDAGKTEKIPISDLENLKSGRPKIDDLANLNGMEYVPIFKPEPIIYTSKLSDFDSSFDSFRLNEKPNQKNYGDELENVAEDNYEMEH